MEFVYADELKRSFSVRGHFYDVEIAGKVFPCRSVLEIIANAGDSEATGVPDAVVIMMNPGSSRPLDISYIPKCYSVSDVLDGGWSRELIPARPDNAQYQLMRLMLLKRWKHVRVLNLSDLRNGNSGSFSVDFEDAQKRDPSSPHSIIHPKRLGGLQRDCAGSSRIVAAWGSTEVLRNAAIAFLSEIPGVQGLQLDYPWYRYPSPYRKDQKIDWLISAFDKLEP